LIADAGDGVIETVANQLSARKNGTPRSAHSEHGAAANDAAMPTIAAAPSAVR
jgi:hypothetical protein